VFPIRDDNPRHGPAVVTAALVTLNLVVWALVEGLGLDPALPQAIRAFGLVPGALTDQLGLGTSAPLGEDHASVVRGAPLWLTPLTSMFLHGSWFHLIGNMWFLWIFGDNVEAGLGRRRYSLFYLVTGLAAAASQIVADPGSPVPMVGASGAISGVMGAYLVLFPAARVHTLVVLGFYITKIRVPAWAMLGYWFLIQLLGSSVAALQGGGAGVAFAAHLGGFVTGAGIVALLPGRRSRPRTDW
jgi:membrane associated rhomboid family serine protease